MKTKNQITTSRNLTSRSFISDLFDMIEGYDNYEKDNSYTVNVAGYAKEDVSVEQVGNLVIVEAENDYRGKRYHRFTISNLQEITEVKYNHGLLEIQIGVKSENTKKIKIK